VKPRSVHTSNNVEAMFDFFEQHSTLLTATMSNEFIVKFRPFRQNLNKLNMFNLFRLCQKDEIFFNIVAKNGNNVEATFDFVQTIVRLLAFDNVALTLLLVWTGLLKVACCFDSVASTLLLMWTELKDEAHCGRSQ